MENAELKDLVTKLVANEKVKGLVKMMEPQDVVAVMEMDLELHKDVAKSVVANLLNHISREGMASLGIEFNKKYPVPPQIRRDNEMDEFYINNLGQMNPDLDPNTLPPKPREEPDEWPFDGMTKAAMDPKNRTPKSPLMQGPFDPNLKKRQAGGDYGGSQGIYSKNSPHFDNSTSTSGRSYDAKGKPGWSSSPPGKEFDLPDEVDGGPSPVGSSIPQFQGGHSQQRRMGFRRR